MKFSQIASKEWLEGVAQEALWKITPKASVRPQASTWPLDSEQLKETTVLWPSKYEWSSCYRWVEPLRLGLAEYVRVERVPIAQPYPGIVLIQIRVKGVLQDVAIDYSDDPNVNDHCAQVCSRYFKMQMRGPDVPGRVLPGGFVPFRNDIYSFLPHIRRLADQRSYLYDAYGRFGSEFSFEVRRKACSILSSQDHFRWEGGVGIKRYSVSLQEIARSKICIDLPGKGDFCFRLIDYFAVGACIIARRHRSTMPVPLVDGVHIAYAKDDLSDLVDLCKFYLANEEARDTLRQNAREYFDRYLHREQLARYYLHECMSAPRESASILRGNSPRVSPKLITADRRTSAKSKAGCVTTENLTSPRTALEQYAGKVARTGLEAFSAIRPKHWAALRLSISSSKRSLHSFPPTVDHLRKAMFWLAAAQDATGSGGVSWGYRLRSAARSGETLGWQAAYPETTGYLIETFLRYSRRMRDAAWLDRAHRMADWETEIQLADGGIQGGTVGSRPVASSTFVTGQVIFGWLQAYEEWNDQRYADAACRAADFLVCCLDDRGRFQSGYSHFCKPGSKAYEVRTGWALALAGKKLGVPRYIDAARRIVDFTLSCQRPNGWFSENDLDDHSVPLTHTIGYTLDGLLELGVLLKDASCREAVAMTLGQMRSLPRENGFLAGRWTSNWKPAGSWSCLTGSCQLASVFLRAHRIFPQDGFEEVGKKLLGFVASTQILTGANPGLVGGIHGSYPFSGAYGRFCNLNWAAKFYADAIFDYLEDREFSATGAAGSKISQPVGA